MQWIKADKQFPNSSGYYFVKDLGDMKRVLWFDKRIFDQEGDNSVCWTDGINKYAGYELIEWLSQSSPPCQCERYREAMQKQIDRLSKLTDDDNRLYNTIIEDLTKALLADGGKEGDGWVRVEDGLPDENAKVWAYNGEDVFQCWFGKYGHDKLQFVDNQKWAYIFQPTHWKPYTLPPHHKSKPVK